MAAGTKGFLEGNAPLFSIISEDFDGLSLSIFSLAGGEEWA